MGKQVTISGYISVAYTELTSIKFQDVLHWRPRQVEV